MRSLEALEREITQLAAQISAATCRWLCLVAEFDRREGWAQWGARSCSHWVAWRCGISPAAAREHVRVARRLQELPLVRGAFANGRLTYSKVRALTRMEGIEREQELLDLARHATAGQLERLVRAYRGVIATEQAAAGERPQRWLAWTHDDDGSLLLRARLPAEEGALVISALEAARDQLRQPAPDTATVAEGASAEAPDTSTAGNDTPAANGATAGDGVAAGGGADATAHGERGVSAEAAEPAVGEARADALVLIADGYLAGQAGERTGGDRYQVLVHVDTATLRTRERGELCELDHDSPIAAETARRLTCDASLVALLEQDGQPLGIGRKTRSIPPAIRRALAARDRGCRFPGCGARRFVQAHHIEHWADGGATSMANLVHLCHHHHRLLHEGGYTLARGDAGTLTFRRPDGKRIVACPPPPRGHTAALRARHPTIAHDACRSLSEGERMDLALGVDALLTWAPPPSSEPPGI
jgi:Domain of unknown function (DUF222)/HNH endonuclease